MEQRISERILTGTHFWEGNTACLEGALAAGCNFLAGYPITPQSEIMERAALRMPAVGGVYIQVEDELAAIAAVVGASWAGAKAMTATSGPGFSLMQEGMGMAIMQEVPCVIVNVQRVGPSTGQATKCAQGDMMQARWGRHGDQAIIAIAPNSPQEMFDFMIKAFNLAEGYRVPVIILADEIVGHMMEQVTVPNNNKIILVNRRKPTAPDEPIFGTDESTGIPPMPSIGDGFNILATTSTHDELGYRRTADYDAHRKLVTRLVNKIVANTDKIVEVENQGLEEAEIGIVSYGCTSRSVYGAMELAKEKGISVGHVRLKTVWPFPQKQVKALSERVGTIIVPELNLGQIVYEVERTVAGNVHVVPMNKIGGGQSITPHEIINQILKSLGRVNHD